MTRRDRNHYLKRSAALAAPPLLVMLAVLHGCGDDDAPPSAEPVDGSFFLDSGPSTLDAAAPRDASLDASLDAPTDGGEITDGGCVVRPGCGSSIGVTITRYSDRAAFTAALNAACTRTVGFDDVDTSGPEPVEIASDRYASLGLLLEGSDGGSPYVDNTFLFPLDYIATSAPNTFAPGPKAPIGAAAGSGGNKTFVTFRSGTTEACVAGFGASFIDVDNASLRSSLTVSDHAGAQLDTFNQFQTASGAATFVGMIAVDGSGNPVPVIARAQIVNGQGYAAVSMNEGAVLDDMTFALPAAP